MAFSALFLENLAELKTRRGNATDTTISAVLGLNYPAEDAMVFYRWFNLATDTPDDYEIVQPTVGGITTGRWFKIDMELTFALVTAALGYVPYDSSNPDLYISNFTELDPTVPAYAKGLTAFSVIKAATDLLYEPIITKNTAFNKNFGTTSGTVTEGNDSRVLNGQTAFGWGNHAVAGYATNSSTNTFTNKSGNISQWTNDSNYLTTVPPQSWSSITGKPTTISGYGITDFNSLGDARWSLLGHTHTFASLTSKPTTLSGFGITDAYPLTGNPSNFLTSISGFTTTNLAEGTNLYFTNARTRTAISLTTTGTGAATYNNTTGVLNIPTPNTVSDNSVTRTINSSTYTISTTKPATVKYNIKIVCTATIGSASTGKVLFQYSIDGGTNWIDAGEVENSNTVTLAVVLNSVTAQSGFIVWTVPANALCRLVPTSTGTTTITWIRGQESY